MFTLSISSWLTDLRRNHSPAHATCPTTNPPLQRPNLSALYRQDEATLPLFVRESSAAMRYLHLLGSLNWDHFPDRPDQRFQPDCPPLPYATVVAAYLIKLDQHLPYVADLWGYLIEHPALVWLLGFPLCPSPAFSWGFDVERSLPTHRHLSRLLRRIPNAALQFLLDDTVRLLVAELQSEDDKVGDCISLDTKHVIAWVKENNPKAYIKGKRFDKTQQPAGDPDCRLGCKRKSNQSKTGAKTLETRPPTPTTNPVPANTLAIGDYYWGYGSGVVATKVADWGEFVLAEFTQPFDQPDVSYFEPLMAETERRLGHRPPFGAFDAAFDAFYIYEYFANAEGFAAVPLVERGGHASRAFSPDGLPLCAAHHPMPLKYVFTSRSTRVKHECGRYVCPLQYPEVNSEACPINHPRWAKGGCVTTMSTSVGARLRYQLDRHSPEYQEVYRQRTTTERINSQAVDLGIERPKLRNGHSIANHNTLTYVLINAHALQRIRQRKAARHA